MSHIQKIIRYFFHHQFSDELVEKVHQRLLVPDEEGQKDEALKTIWEEIESPELSSEQMDAAFARLQHRLGEPETKIHLRFLRLSHFMRIAAIWFVPLLLLSISLYFYKETITVRNELADVSFVEYYVPSGKRELLTLPDSSKVWLNSGSLLVYPSTFIGDKREVYLAGEGYFDVQKDAEFPFIVKVRGLQVGVLGTKFNLSGYPSADKVTTTLEEGSVKVLLDKVHASYMLKPNEQLIYTPKTEKVELQKVHAVDYSDWKEGGLLFKSCPFDEVMATLERVYDIHIHLQTSIYKNNRLTIHFNKHEQLEKVMMLIREIIPALEYRIEGKEVYILSH
ncbi:FecR family protein [Bacteroides sp.]